MIEIQDTVIQEELSKIPPLTRETYFLTDSIASRIEFVMKEKGINKKQLAQLTHKKPSEITKWLGGGHNFTCKTLVLISHALGEKIIQVVQ